MDSYVDSYEKLLMGIILKVKKSGNKRLSFCYKVFCIFVEVINKRDINNSEILHNYGLNYKLMDTVLEASGDMYQLLPDELRLNAIKNK